MLRWSFPALSHASKQWRFVLQQFQKNWVSCHGFNNIPLKEWDSWQSELLPKAHRLCKNTLQRWQNSSRNRHVNELCDLHWKRMKDASNVLVRVVRTCPDLQEILMAYEEGTILKNLGTSGWGSRHPLLGHWGQCFPRVFSWLNLIFCSTRFLVIFVPIGSNWSIAQVHTRFRSLDLRHRPWRTRALPVSHSQRSCMQH